MSISSIMYTSSSGLFSLGEKMEALSDNLANIETTGFRASQVSFEDIFFETTNTGGVRLNSRGFTSDFSSEGSIYQSHIPTHMAITGEGFFILRDPGQTNSTYYARAGEFSFDSGGYLVNPGDHIVQGFGFDNQGRESTLLADIQLNLTTPDPTPIDPNPVPRLLSSPTASTRLTTISNLDSGSLDHSPGGLFNIWDATKTTPITTDDYELRTGQDIFDGSGNRNLIEVYYDKTSQNNIWEYLITAPPAGAGTVKENGVLARGNITFNYNGQVSNMSIENFQGGGWVTGAPNSNGYLTFQTPFAGSPTVELDIGARVVNGVWRSDSRGTTHFGYESFTRFSNSDGNGRGDFLNFSISSEGIISADFDNGVTSDLFRVALANSNDPSSQLRRIGQSLYQLTPGSNVLTNGIPGSSGLGIIVGGSLETSNVDLADQFGDLIFTQRALQANAKGFAAADEMLKTLIGLKR